MVCCIEGSSQRCLCRGMLKILEANAVRELKFEPEKPGAADILSIGDATQQSRSEPEGCCHLERSGRQKIVEKHLS